MSVSPAPCQSAPRSGRVAAVHGSVVDLAFAQGMLPAINEAVAVEWDLGPPLVAEVQQHLGPEMVRGVALGNTAGLRRGTRVRALGAPIRAPVGDAVLGRLLGAIGEPIDHGSPCRQRSSIGLSMDRPRRSPAKAAPARSFKPASRSSTCWRR
jgi:F0F1-type ATP synthase beta subunit